MSIQMSIRLDEAVHQELEADAKAQGIGLATYLRALAAAHAKEVRRTRIRAESSRVGALYHHRTDVQEFYDATGSSDPLALEKHS